VKQMQDALQCSKEFADSIARDSKRNPGRTDPYLPYISGVRRYRRICEKIAAEGYKGFRFQPKSAALPRRGARLIPLFLKSYRWTL
jgi:hypothetical protein